MLPNEMISRRQLETAWKLSVIAADWHEQQNTDESRNKMVEAADYAEKMQAQFDRQYDEQNKRVVLAFNGKLKVDPDFCDHKNAYIVYRDADGTNWKCPDCGSLLDEDGVIIKTGTDDEIPY